MTAGGSAEQVVHRGDMEKHHIVEDKHEVQGAVALAFPNAGRGQMTFDAQLGKQIFHPEVQLLAKLFEGRFDLSLKVSDLSVMQEVAPFLWFLLIISLN